MCCLEFVGKVMAFLLAMLFILFIPNAVWTIHLQRTALNADTYVDTFSEQNAYENVVPLILPALAEGMGVDQNTGETHDIYLPGQLEFNAVIENLDQDDWNAIAREVIPPDYLQEQAEKNLIIFFDFLNGKRPRMDVVFDTYVVRDNMLGQPGNRMVNRIFTSWPECNAVSERQVVQFLEGENEEFPYCRPQDSDLDRAVFEALTASKDELAYDIPEYWNWREERAKREDLTLNEVDLSFHRARIPIILMNELYPLAFLCPASLLFMMVILAVRSTRGFLLWTGLPLIFGGMLTLLPLILVPFMISALYAGGAGANDQIQEEAARGILRTMLGEFTSPILIQCAIIIGAGFLCVFMAVLVSEPEDLPAPPMIVTSSGSTTTPLPQFSGHSASNPALAGRLPRPPFKAKRRLQRAKMRHAPSEDLPQPPFKVQPPPTPPPTPPPLPPASARLAPSPPSLEKETQEEPDVDLPNEQDNENGAGEVDMEDLPTMPPIPDTDNN